MILSWKIWPNYKHLFIPNRIVYALNLLKYLIFWIESHGTLYKSDTTNIQVVSFSHRSNKLQYNLSVLFWGIQFFQRCQKRKAYVRCLLTMWYGSKRTKLNRKELVFVFILPQKYTHCCWCGTNDVNKRILNS